VASCWDRLAECGVVRSRRTRCSTTRRPRSCTITSGRWEAATSYRPTRTRRCSPSPTALVDMRILTIARSVTDGLNAAAEIHFTGNAISLYGATSSNHGAFSVSLDGAAPVILNGTAPTFRPQTLLVRVTTPTHSVYRSLGLSVPLGPPRRHGPRRVRPKPSDGCKRLPRPGLCRRLALRQRRVPVLDHLVIRVGHRAPSRVLRLRHQYRRRQHHHHHEHAQQPARRRSRRRARPPPRARRGAVGAPAAPARAAPPARGRAGRRNPREPDRRRRPLVPVAEPADREPVQQPVAAQRRVRPSPLVVVAGC
jgi:hypothetical protein